MLGVHKLWLPIYMFTFAVMTGVWCAAGYKLVNNALVGQHIRRYGHILLPVALIAIGVWILRGASALMR